MCQAGGRINLLDFIEVYRDSDLIGEKRVWNEKCHYWQFRLG